MIDLNTKIEKKDTANPLNIRIIYPFGTAVWGNPF